MRTWITLITVFILLVSVVLAERYVINEFGQRSENCCREIEAKIICKNITNDDFNNIKAMWEETKDCVYIFANHDSFSDIETSIAFMESGCVENDLKQVNDYLIKFRKCVESIVDASLLNFANIF